MTHCRVAGAWGAVVSPHPNLLTIECPLLAQSRHWGHGRVNGCFWPKADIRRPSRGWSPRINISSPSALGR